jgi:hypothetical protein
MSDECDEGRCEYCQLDGCTHSCHLPDPLADDELDAMWPVEL